MKQLGELGRDRGVLDQRRPQIILRIGNADLAQVAREAAQHRDVAPGQAGREHQRVEPVALGEPAHHHHEAGFQARLEDAEAGLGAVGLRQRHVVQPEVGRVAPGGLRLVGGLVDHAEAHVLEHGHALAQRDRALAAPDLEPDGLLLLPQALIEIDPERACRGERFDHPDVVDGDQRRIGLAVGVRKGVAIARQQRLRPRGFMRHPDRVGEPVGPGAHDVGHRAFELGARGARHLAGAARDDEMHAHQRAFRKEQREGGHAPPIGVGEHVADLLADRAVEAVARHVDQHRHETVEAVAPRQHAHARAFLELEDHQPEAQQRVLADLEELVARILLQHDRERLAGMAVRVEARARDHGSGLAAQIRDAEGRARIGGRGEQPDDAEDADQPAGGVVALDADQVHGDAAVDARLLVGLDDDQRLRLLEEGARRGRHLQPLAALGHHFIVAVSQDPEHRVGLLGEHAGGLVIGVAAHPQEGEIVVQQPLQELDRLGDLVGGQRRRPALEIRDGLVQAREHRPPVGDRELHLGQRLAESAEDLRPALLVVDPLDMDMDEAFALAVGGEVRQAAVRVAPDGEHRVGDQLHHQALVGELAHGRVEQEGLVVVEDLDDRNAAEPAVAGGLFHPQPEGAGLALGEELPAALGEPGELVGLVVDQVLGRGAAEQELGEILRRPAGELGAGRRDEPARLAVLAAVDVLGCDRHRFVHGTLNGPLRAFDPTRLAGGSVSLRAARRNRRCLGGASGRKRL